MTARELTADAPGAVRIVEVLGDTSGRRLARMFERELPRPGALAIGRLTVGDDTLDEALVLRRSDGALEVHLHGAKVIVERVLAQFPAAELAAAEPTAWLTAARTEAAARVALDQLEGAFERELRALLEGHAVPDDATLDELLARAAFGRDLFEPRRVVLAGPTNAGKSTLFNVLVGSDRVLTSGEAGTTRDAIEELAELAGFPVWLVDTAGWREVVETSAQAQVEREGQARGRREAKAADLVLWCSLGEPAPPEFAGLRVLELGLQADRVAVAGRPALSAQADPAGAARTVAAQLTEAFGWPDEPWSAGRAVPLGLEPTLALEEARAADGSARRERLERLLAESSATG